MLVIFFFSSRRRHTRFSRDWSSDVCSSDLEGEQVVARLDRQVEAREPLGDGDVVVRDRGRVGALEVAARPLGGLADRRASCRERVEISAGAGSLKKRAETRADVENRT